MRLIFSLSLGLTALATACAPAPLYLSSGQQRPVRGAVTTGEVPRDAMGEPVWSAIRPMNPYALAPATPPALPAQNRTDAPHRQPSA